MESTKVKYCKHQEWLINQGVHWCGIQSSTYPDCKNCPNYEEVELNITYSSTSSKTNLDEISSSKKHFKNIKKRKDINNESMDTH